MPTTFSGRFEPSAIAVIGSEDVLEAKTVSGPVADSTSARIARFRSRFSNTASGALPASSYPMSLTSAPFEEFLPPTVLDSLRAGLTALCERLPILRHPEAVIVGPESRSSCPVRIVRDHESLQSPSSAGLYPMGEGAGYAGGIVSAAIDGLRCAEAFVARVSGDRTG